MIESSLMIDPNTTTKEKIRNVAVIAHVDHGKTTLIDGFLKQTNLFRENQEEMSDTAILDSNELEKEKGITILSKTASVIYKDYKINIIDTPGHADFGGEVERTLSMANGCILVIDAQEGVMSQTEFVLKQAFENNLKTIVVINKIDKKLARVNKVKQEIEDLFLKLAVNEDQLNFPIFYAIASEGKVFTKLPDGDLTASESTSGDILPLLDEVISYIPAPNGDLESPCRMQISSLDYDNHVGRFLIGRIDRGTISAEQTLKIASLDDGKPVILGQGKPRKIYTKIGIEYIEIEKGVAGDIIAIGGIDSTAIGATICQIDTIEPLPQIKLSPPTVKVEVQPNNSPFVGKEGKFSTAKQLEQRLEYEKEINIGLKICRSDSGSYEISGRGELQLAILFETMRREGYEFQVKSPEIIMKKIGEEIHEPIENLTIDAPEEFMGTIQDALSQRSAQLQDIQNNEGVLRFNYKIATRNLLGLRYFLLNMTKGTAVLSSYISGYEKKSSNSVERKNGVLVSMETGEALAYALNAVQERGELFIKPGDKIYEGMIVGINKYEGDLEVNPAKGRHQTSVRMSRAEITQISLKSPIQLTIEYALVFISKDEMIEITPQSLRLRKIFLTKTERDWSKRKNLTTYAKANLGKLGR
ncbi:GTP-binding protein [Candidatus Dojkabacteria bacterium]|nr:GTP-binding protein [Candidatus Dojkabacteria bacterium]